MEREQFALHLTQAARSTLAFTRTQCWNPLAEQVNFLIRPDTLSDDPAPYLNTQEWACFQDRKRELGQPLSAADVVERLWVECQVPAYVNISVYHAGPQVTTLELFIDRRLRRELADLYHEREGYPPFHVLVAIPPYVGNRQTTFHSNWQHWPWRLKLVLWRGWWRMRHQSRSSLKS
jgi:hypothetical protein